MKKFKFTFWLFALLLIGFTTQAQVTGTKNVPGDYLTLQDAITALNTEGVGAGGATINLIAGNPQTAPAGGYVIGGAGSALFASTSNANQVIIKGNGNTITASGSLTAGALNDAIFKIIGADWITIQEFVMQDNAANTVTTAASNTMTEWGVALLYETTTNGAQNNTILNNTISLVRTYQNTFGIYSNSTHSATVVTTSATATTANGGNSNLKIYGNSISNVNNGICVVGPTAAADHNNGVDIGGTSAITGNIISNYGSTGTFSSYSNVSGSVNGVLVRNSINLNISYNNITSSNAGTTSGTLRGVFCPAFSNTPIGTFIQNITNNVISVIGGNATGTAIGVLCESTVANTTSTLNINNNTFQNSSITGSTSGSIIGLQNSASSIIPGTLNMNNNIVQNNSLSGTGTFTGIDGGVSTNLFMNNNTVSNNTKTGASGSMYLTRAGTSIVTYSGNNVFDNSFTASSGTSSAIIYGYYNYGSPTVENIYNNNIYNLYINGTNTSTSSLLNGIHTNTTSTATKNIYNNTIHTFTTVSGSVNGISQSLGTTVKIYKNNIYNLLNNVATTSVAQVNGITVSSGTCYLYNNFISDLKAPASAATDAVRGINITSTSTSSTIGVYHNTIYLNASSTGANFGTTGIFHTVNTTATTASLDMRNNIINNSSSPAGTGLTVAFRRSGTALNNYNDNSNNNILYAGVASASNLLCYDGTTGDQTRDEFRTRVTPRDASSFAENTTFINTATTPYNLRVNTGIASYCESGGNTVSTPISITDDFDGTVRGILPDVGANEFNGIAAGLLNPSAVTATTISSNQINVAFTPNASSNNVVIVWNTTGTFTTPSGAPGAVGDAFAGGTILSIGTTSPINHTSLTGNTTYYYKLFSNAGTDYSTGVTVNANTNLAAPTAFTATASSASQINLVWTKNSFDNNVIIATNSTSTFGTPVQATAYAVNDPITGGGTVIYNGPASGFNHTSLTASTTYYYKAWSVDGNSYYSSGVSANANTTMLAPTAFTATVISASQINLAWTKNSFNNDVIVATNSTSTFGTPVNGTPLAVNDAIVGGGTVIYKGAATGYNHTSLTANTAYYYKAWSVDESSNYSSASVSANATTPCNVISTFPNIENFEATTIPSCWSELRTPTSSSYGWTSYATGYENKGFRFDSYVNSSGNKSMLKTPTYNISALSSARIEFWWKNPTGGNFKVLLSTDGGVTFPNTLADNLTAQTDWVLKAIDISAYISGGNNVVIGFEGTSNWGSDDAYVYLDKFSIGEIPSCGYPTALNTGTITTTSAVLNWTAPAEGIPTGYNWIVVARGAGSGAATVANGTSATTTATANGLTSATEYDFFVKTNCGATFSNWAGPFNFTTLCSPATAPTTMQDFSSYTGSAPNPICWSEATDTLIATTTLTTTTSRWTNASGFANTGSNTAVKINLYSTNVDWIISNQIDLGATPGIYRVKYKYAVTSYNGTTSQSTLGTHKVQVVVSTDGGTTWSNTNVIKEYTGVGTYSNTGATEAINLTGYSGIVKIAFVATTKSNSPDIDFHIDNFVVEAIPTCFEPTAITVSNINPSGATFSWTAPVNGTPANYIWKVVASDSAATASAIATGTVAHPNLSTSTSALSANTPYTLYVKTDCGSGDNSVWTEAKNFKTLCNYVNIPVVQNFDGATTPNMPDCWNKLVVSTSGSLTTTTGTPNSTPNHAYFYNSSDNASNILLISPGIVQNLNTTQVKFYAKGGGAGYPVILGTMTDPTNAATFTPLNTFNLTANYTLYEFYLNNYAGTDKFIALKHGNGGTYRSIYVDDISIEALPTCFKPNTLTVTPATTSASIAWVNGKPTDTSWEISYKKPTDGSWTVVTANSNPFTITPLEANTSYQVKVRTDCGAGDFSDFTSTVNFNTTQLASGLPFTEGFETGLSNWTVLNGSQTNKWFAGTATFNSGAQAAYISNDNGVTNAYTTSSASSITHIYRDIAFPTGNPVDMTFNWKGQGEDSYDFLKVYMIPTTITPVEGTEIDAAYQVGAIRYNLQSAWQTANIALPSNILGTTYRLVFSWKNNGYGGAQPPIAIDDINITQQSCATPAIALTGSTPNSITINWATGTTDVSYEVQYWRVNYDLDWTTVTTTTKPYTISGLAEAAEYNVRVRTVCGASEYSEWSTVINFITPCNVINLPYSENFATAAFPACWSQTYSGTLTSNRWTVSTTNSAGGTANEMKASYQNNTGISRLIMPALNTVGLSEIQLKFKTYYSDDDIGANLKIQTSNDKINWTDAYTYATGSGDIPSGTTITVPITTNLNGTTYIAYVIDGNHFKINYWYIDNVIVLAPSNAKEITALTIPNQVGNSVIDGGTATVVVTMPYGTDKTALIPTITVSDFASINPASDVAQNFTAAVPYTVTAENNTTKVWTVTVNNLPPSTEAEITALTIPGQVGVSEIISATGTINVHVPYGTNRNGLVPTITTSTFATINPSSDVAQNFNSPVVYTVTAQDVSVTKLWTVNVIVDPASQEADILSFSLAEQTHPAVIDNVNHTVHIEVAAGTNRNGLIPTITVSQYAAINPLTGVAQDFTVPFVYTVTAQDPTVIKQWTVTVTEAPYVLVKWDFPNSPDDNIADGGIAANLTKTIGSIGTNAISYATGVTTQAISANGWANGMNTKYWQIDFTTQGYKNITLSSVQRSSGTGPRDYKVQYKIGASGSWTDIANTNIRSIGDFTTGVLPETNLPIETANKADVFVRWIMTSDTNANGTIPIVATGTNRIDDIIVRGVPMMHDAEIISFVTNLTQTGPAIINSANATVTVNVPNGTSVTSVIPTIGISDMATINPASGVTQDFTNPVSYTVTAEDGTQKVWTVTIIVDPIPAYTVAIVSPNGTTTGSGSYVEAAEVTLTATPNEGYEFVNWSDINGVVSIANPFTFAMPANNLNYTANFVAIDYTVTVVNTPVAGGSVVGGGTYHYGDAVSLIATPTIGYNFINWTVNGTEVSTALTYNFNMPSHNVDIVANYAIVDYTVAITSDPVVGGTTSGAGSYNYNNAVSLTATPAIGYSFVNWTDVNGVVSSANPFTFNMPAENLTYTANFVENDYTLTVNAIPAIGGTVTGNNPTYNYNDLVSLVATPEVGYEFLNWTINGAQVSTDANYSFNMPANNVTITANFVLIGTTTYDLDLTVSPANSGNVVGAGSYVDGTVVTLTATPAAGYTFVSWTDGATLISSNASFGYTMPNSNKSLVANFVAIDYSVSANINPLTSGTVAGEGTTYHVGDIVTLTATPAQGYEFVNWTDVNGEVSNMNPHTFSMPAENVNITANFALINYTVAASTLPANAGSITGTGTYTFGQSVTLETTPNAGFTFVNWTVEGTEVSTTTTYTFTMPSSNVTAVANYTANDYNVTVAIDPIATGTVSGTGIYHVGDEVTITATPEAGYVFVNWTNTIGEVSIANPFTFTMGASDVSLTANFAAIDYTVTTNVLPAGAGTVTGANTYNVGNTVTVTATANSGYIFENWSDENGIVSTNALYTFTMPASNVVLTANFTAVDYSVTVNVDPVGSGTITGTGNYNVGQTVSLTATPVAGYNFVNWTDGTGEVSTNATYSFTMPAANVELTAHFVAIDYTVTVNVAPAASGTTTGAGTYTVGQSVTLTATPAAGYEFVNWTEGANVLGTAATYNFTMPASDKVITANFAVITYPLTLQVNPVAAGSVSGAGSYAEGTAVTVSTTPASANFVFLNWTNGATVVSTSPSFSYTMPNAATTLVANYRDVTSISENNSTGISVYPNPSNGIFNLVVDKAYDMQIVDVTGRLVLTQRVDAGLNTLHMEQNNVGVYFIRLISNSEIKTVRIVKQQ